MAVNVSKIWRGAKFQSLSTEARLLYIYLVTSPDLNTLGLLDTGIQSIKADLIFNESEFREACRVLQKDFIVIFKADEQIYFYVIGHFNTLPKSVAVSKKAHKDLAKLPENVVQAMHDLEIMPSIEKHVEFNAPTIEEVEEYALSKGHLISGKTVIEFYEGKAQMFGKKGWYDSRGKAVRDWKAKIRKVWCKDENKLEKCDGAPEGFEYFFVKDGDKQVTPDYWKDGLPRSKGGLIENKLLEKEFKKRTQK